LVELDRRFEVMTPQGESKESFVEALAASKTASFSRLVEELSLSELKHLLRLHDLSVTGNKAALQERLLGQDKKASPERAQTDLFAASAPEEDAEATQDELAAFFARAQPSVSGIFALLEPKVQQTLIRRLQEQHAIKIDFAALPGLHALAAALEQVCDLPILFAELSREHLAKACTYYAIGSGDGSAAAMVRSLLAAHAGLTDEEAEVVESEVATAFQAPAPAPLDAEKKVDPARERYRQILAAKPRTIAARVAADFDAGDLPMPGELVRVRQRQYLVKAIVAPGESQVTSAHLTGTPAHLVSLVCLDDDAQGRELDVLWEIELGAKRIDPSGLGLALSGDAAFDSPPKFAAYYRALQWNCVTTATRPDKERVQAPFRAGIAVMQHQMVPLQKALALPRANLFIADDVGLGKTIEAGLIMQELLLRQRLDFLLIVCPASICLQWQGEMEKRFGIRLEIVNREWIAKIRKDRGFTTNPWTCGRRFIVSYQTLRRPEYREGLRVALGERALKSLLVLDEAHSVAPASPGHYAVDSQLTKLVRDLAPRFENRLFLSATPHNGHSNSFSALLELLDPSRFTRGVAVENREKLAAVMIRRLKRDLMGFSSLHFPVRRLLELQVRREGEMWHVATQEATTRAGNVPAADTYHLRGELTKGESPELELAALLRQYTELCAPASKRDKMVFVGLQKRLLSSIAAFSRTLRVHVQRSGQKLLEALDAIDGADASDTFIAASSDAQGQDDETFGEEYDLEIERRLVQSKGAALPEQASLRESAQALLEKMQTLCARAHNRPEGKFLALLAWIRKHQLPSAGSQWFGENQVGNRKWSPTRLIIFTEYADTAAYLLTMLRAATSESDRSDERIAYFHGAMSDDQRRELQANFNASPQSHPVRILVATDAAREGVNLQAHCADLIHYDIPWNPGRLEQRNGRIDRTLQPSAQVRCMYFAYPQREEDRVLQVLVEKVQRIGEELGSLSAVVLERIENVLEPQGIGRDTQSEIEAVSQIDAQSKAHSHDELEAARSDLAQIHREVEAAGVVYERSKGFFAAHSQALRDTVSVALQLAGAGNDGAFTPAAHAESSDDSQHYLLPPLPDDWQHTLDTLRPPRPKDIAPWEWRKQTPPKPVVFEPLTRMTDDVVQLHLAHPLVKRALSRFSAQGYGAHDLSRVAMLRYDGSQVRVVMIGRLTLFGAGASRLHDALVHVVAEVQSDGQLRRLVSAEARDKAVAEFRSALLHDHGTWQAPEALCARHIELLPGHLRELWPHVRQEARDEGAELVRLLDDRGAAEAETLQKLIAQQQAAISRALAENQIPSDESARSEVAQNELRQRKLDAHHLQNRLRALELEGRDEPPKLRAHYHVLSTRIEAVGAAYLLPKTR
jgi:hypothetical protein